MWEPAEEGAFIGTKGSEDGIIVLDEEHTDGARITLERDGGAAPWAITCGIYGCFLHTTFASTEEEGRTLFEKMKPDLVRIMREGGDEQRYEKMHDFAERY